MADETRDMETFLRGAINEVCPDLQEVSKNMLEERLQTLGIETAEDFKFIQEEDVSSVLRPIQARKAVAFWKFKYQDDCSADSPGPSQSPQSPSTTSSFNTAHHGAGPDWTDKFKIPWSSFPEALVQCLERGQRPRPALRREMVRIVVRQMLKDSALISKRNAIDVAQKIVARYPKSLQDVIEGDVIGAGYHSSPNKFNIA
ncbi:uncharacterized protein LOC127659801 [Xyrauchen texanus]|uniref:uncharacterized protein LOC127659801 n=1 Tax=Xyrauchen texanus TaxID=154827 RepID=UPI0022425CE5|nr:uncharacterized protein LOC127659801 [Xyrauchen texanus]